MKVLEWGLLFSYKLLRSDQMDTAKSAAISARILAYVANGSSLKEAFHYVLGPGYYDCLVEELYQELRAKAA